LTFDPLAAGARGAVKFSPAYQSYRGLQSRPVGPREQLKAGADVARGVGALTLGPGGTLASGAIGGAFNLFQGGSFTQGAVEGMALGQQYGGLTRFTSPIVSKFAPGGVLANRLGQGLLNVGENAAQDFATGRNPFDPTSIGLGFVTGVAGRPFAKGSKGAIKANFRLDNLTYKEVVTAEDMVRNPRQFLGNLGNFSTRKAQVLAEQKAIREIQKQGAEIIDRISAKYMPDKDYLRGPIDPLKRVKRLIDLHNENKLANVPGMGFAEGGDSRSTTPKTPEKLEVGGGNYSTERINVSNKLDTEVRSIAQKLEPEIAVQRGGVKTLEQTLQESKQITLEEATKNSKKYPGDAMVYAQSSWIKTLSEKVQELKNLNSADPRIVVELQKTQKQLDELIITSLSKTSTEAGRTLKAHQYLAETLSQDAQTQLKDFVVRNPDRWPDSESVVGLLNKFDTNDRVGMIKFLSEIQKNTPVDKLEAIWYNNILSGISTQIVNNMGNMGRTFWNIATKPTRVASDIATSAITGTPRQEFLNEWGPEAIGAISGYRDGFRRFVFSMKTGLREADVADLNVPSQPLKGKLGRAYSIPSRALVAFDELFRGVNRSMEINRQAFSIAKAEKLTGDAFLKRVGELVAQPTSDMAKRADELASELLYQKASAELASVGGLRDMIKIDIPKLGTFKPLKFVIPFIQVPVNVAKFGYVETTPVGGLATLLKGKDLERLEFNRRMGSALMGTAGIAALATYFSEERITGRPPSNAKERDAFYAKGMQPYSIKIGDRWVQYNRLPDPLASHLSIIAGYHDTFKDKGELPAAEKIQGLVMSFGRGLADRTFLAGISDLMNAIEDPERYGGSYMRNLASSLAVPWASFTGSIARTVDQTVRDPQTIGQAIQAKIPGLSQNVPARASSIEESGVATRKYPAYQEFLPTKVTQETKLTPKQIINLPAKSMFTELQSLDKSTANKIAKYVKRNNPTLYYNLKQVAADEKLQITPQEVKLRNMNVDARSQEVWRQLGELKTSEEKNRMLKRWKAMGIISDRVMKELKKISKVNRIK
jgi:hypothetical protein